MWHLPIILLYAITSAERWLYAEVCKKFVVNIGWHELLRSVDYEVSNLLSLCNPFCCRMVHNIPSITLLCIIYPLLTLIWWKCVTGDEDGIWDESFQCIRWDILVVAQKMRRKSITVVATVATAVLGGFSTFLPWHCCRWSEGRLSSRQSVLGPGGRDP